MPESAVSALACASRLAQTRGSSPRFGVSSILAGRNSSGSMPAWLIRLTRRGEPEARTNLGRPIMVMSTPGWRANCADGRRPSWKANHAVGMRCRARRRRVRKARPARGAETSGSGAESQPQRNARPMRAIRSAVRLLFVAGGGGAEALPDPPHELVADLAIGVEPLLAVA